MRTLAASRAKDYFIGAEIGGYRIIDRLGEGAMGVVYRGEHRVLGRKAAIKFLSAELASNAELVARFFTEARAVNGIRHPNIVDITDFGQRGNRHYYVMELLEGETLAQRLSSETRVPHEAIIRIGAQVASALAAAHDEGIVHRDLKPDNIFLCNHPDYPDYVKLFDFGIAKLVEGQQDGQTYKTRAGSVMGTPIYMSPEQCTGDEQLDHRSDIYSLGIMLYQMAAGVPPFNYDQIPQILLGHLNESPDPPSRHFPEISTSLESVILQAIAKKPEDRFADMRSLRAALLACADPHASPEDVGRAASDAEPKSEEQIEEQEREAAAGAQKLVAELNSIILERIEADRLVLPAMPAAAIKAMKLLDNANVTFHQLAKILAGDPVIAPQIFRKSSAAHMGASDRPKTIEQAISRLGFGNLKALLVELSAHRVYDSRNRKIRAAFKGIWDHTIAVATAAQMIVKELGNGLDPQLAHLAGLMHDVGKPVVGGLLLEAEKMLGMKKDEWLNEENWLRVVEQCHRPVGRALAEKWELPAEVVGAVSGCARYSQGSENQFANVVRFANAFAKRCGKGVGDFDEDVVEDIVVEGVELLGLDWVFVHDTLRSSIQAVGQDDSPGNRTSKLAARR